MALSAALVVSTSTGFTRLLLRQPRTSSFSILYTPLTVNFLLPSPLTNQLVGCRSSRRSLIRMASTASSEAGAAKEKTTAPYGSWKSPLSAEVISGGQKRLEDFAVDGRGRLIWVESRPTEAGRGVLVVEGENPGSEPLDLTPKGFAVRTLAQEYGGGAFAVSGDTVVFSNYKDQRLYKQSISAADSPPSPVTPDYGGPLMCYADGVFDSRFQRFITVMEDHRESKLNPVTTIAAVSLSDNEIKEPKILLSGNDFYAFPRIDPKGERIAWIEWGHPNMPWDKTELWVGYISEDGGISKRTCVAGGNPALIEAPAEPKWTSEGELYFVTDRNNGFWNLYKWVESKNEVVLLHSMEAEFTGPLWVFGASSYVFVQTDKKSNKIACSYRQKGMSYLAVLDEADSSLSLLDIPFTDIGNIVSGNNSLFIEGASATEPSSVAKVTLDDHLRVADFKSLWSSSPESSKYKSYYSVPEFIEFPTEVPGKNAYAYFYPPSNPLYQASDAEKPPLLLKSHGGPTAETRGSLNLQIQYWTSRGWAFVDVNYGGSTGYGREYRERLYGLWGTVDVDDCCSCAKFLADAGKVDVNRLCITGGSAGGYTTLAALAFKKTFKAGASLYGVADLNLLRAETHKFESRYMDNLVGSEEAFFEKSPINHVNGFSCPIILFQGLEDKIVPPDQARKIYKALKEKGLPVALVEYEGEQHGFRKAENIKFTVEQEMVFFARTVGKFTVADDITPIKIDNFAD